MLELDSFGLNIILEAYLLLEGGPKMTPDASRLAQSSEIPVGDMADGVKTVDLSTDGGSQSATRALVDDVNATNHSTEGEDHFDGATNVEVSSEATAKGDARVDSKV
jgi:hypothetical protein